MKRDNTRSHCLHCSPLNGGNDREGWEGKMRERNKRRGKDDGEKKRKEKKIPREFLINGSRNNSRCIPLHFVARY